MSCIDSLYSVLTKLSGHRYSLYELAAWKNGLAFNKINFSKTGIPVIKISELVNGINQTTAFTQQQFCKELFIHKGDYGNETRKFRNITVPCKRVCGRVTGKKQIHIFCKGCQTRRV